MTKIGKVVFYLDHFGISIKITAPGKMSLHRANSLSRMFLHRIDGKISDGSIKEFEITSEGGILPKIQEPENA